MTKQDRTTLDLYNEAMDRMKELTGKNDLAIISSFYDGEPNLESTEKMKRIGYEADQLPELLRLHLF